MNVSSDGDDVTVAGKLFHTRAAATGKAQSPTVDKRVKDICTDDVVQKQFDVFLRSDGYIFYKLFIHRVCLTRRTSTSLFVFNMIYLFVYLFIYLFIIKIEHRVQILGLSTV